MSELQNPKETAYSGVLISLSAAEETNLAAREIEGQVVRDIPKALGRQFRKVQPAAYDKDARTVTMAVSSETPVERYYGQEILSHAKGAIRTGRLENGVSLLFNHDYDLLLGRSQSFTLGDPMHVTSRFGESALAKEKEADVEAKILVDVSIGYLVYEWEITEDKNGVRTYLAVDWELLEVSLVTVPADPTVGVGRSIADAVPVKVRSFKTIEGDTAGLRQQDSENADPEDDDDEDDEDPDESERSTQPTETQKRIAPTMADVVDVNDLKAKEQERVAALRAIRTANPGHYTEDALFEDIRSDAPVAAAKERVADAIIKGAQSSNLRTLGEETLGNMSGRERKAYSLRNVLCAAVNQRNPGTFKDKGSEAGFEREVSETLKKEAGERGFREFGPGIVVPSFLPFDGSRSMQQRTVTAGSAGGSTVGPNSIVPTIESGMIELLRARTIALALGARYMTGMFGTPRFLRQNATAQSNWLAEMSPATSSDPGLDFFGMSPKRLSIMNQYTLEVLAQSPIAIEDMLRDDRNQVLARSLDAAIVVGPGTNGVPQGLLNYTGLAAILPGTTKSAAGVRTPGTGNSPLTFVDCNDFESAISTANGDIGTMGWAGTTKIRGDLRTTQKQPGVASPFILPDSTPNADGVQAGPLGYNFIATSASYMTNYTQGSTTGLHAMILGVWDQLMVGDWGLNEVIADNVTGAAQALYKITEHGLYDVAVRHIEAFAAATSVKTS